jgi:spore germination protein GerM
MPRSLPALLLAAALLAGPACSASTGDTDDGTGATDTTNGTAPPETPDTQVPTSAAPGELFAVSPWFLAGEVVVPGQPRFVQGPDVLASTLDALLAGPSEEDLAAGLGTGITAQVRVLSIVVDGDTAIVDLNRAFETADTQPQVAQVVYTLTELAGITQVKFLIDGEDNGATGVRPLGRDSTRVQPG